MPIWGARGYKMRVARPGEGKSSGIANPDMRENAREAVFRS